MDGYSSNHEPSEADSPGNVLYTSCVSLKLLFFLTKNKKLSFLFTCLDSGGGTQKRNDLTSDSSSFMVTHPLFFF